MMWHRNTAQIWVFSAIAAFSVCTWVGISTLGAAEARFTLAAADEPESDADARDGSRAESPGTMQRHRDLDEPSEDGTEDAPVPALPEAPPGCTYHGGSLELFV